MFREDRFLDLLEKLHIDLGDTTPGEIRAWFDTDSADLLTWITENVSEANYLSPQEEKEFNELERHYSPEEIEKFEEQHPELFDVEGNLIKADIAKLQIEDLEAEIEENEAEISKGKLLHESLMKEYEAVCKEQDKVELSVRQLKEKCEKLTAELDEVNAGTAQQLQKYSKHLKNFETVSFPTFLHQVDLSGLERDLKTTLELPKENMEMDSPNDTFAELENRVFQAVKEKLALQLQAEAPGSENSFVSGNESLIGSLEETALKETKELVAPTQLTVLKREETFLGSKLGELKQFELDLETLSCHLIILYNLLLQERLDITSSTQLFKNTYKYAKRDVTSCIHRKDSMLKVTDKLSAFLSLPLSEKMPIVRYFTNFFSAEDLGAAVDRLQFERHSLEMLKKQISSPEIITFLPKLLANIQVFEKLLSGPTLDIITVPRPLQRSFVDIDEVINKQNTCVKSLVKLVQQFKNCDGANHRTLWALFMTDGERMLELFKNN